MRHKFDAEIIKAERKGGISYITVPVDIAKEFNAKGRIKVKGEINGVSYRNCY